MPRTFASGEWLGVSKVHKIRHSLRTLRTLKTNMFDFVKNVRGEMKHVSWPTKRQAIWYTTIVIVISIITAIILGFFDFVFTTILDKFII